jgi:hypothetical protein
MAMQLAQSRARHPVVADGMTRAERKGKRATAEQQVFCIQLSQLGSIFILVIFLVKHIE